MKFRAVGFDYGGVVAGKVGFRQAAVKLLRVTDEAWGLAFFAHNAAMNRGEYSFEHFLGLIASDLDRVDQLPQLVDLADEYWGNHINPDLIQIADELKTRRYRTGILSNNSVKNANFMRESGLGRHFEVIHISSETGVPKPAPEAFRQFAVALGVKTGELVFIDDGQVNLDGAEGAGCAGILFTDAAQLRAELTTLGLLSAR